MLVFLLGLATLLLAYRLLRLPYTKWSSLKIKSTKPLPLLGNSLTVLSGKETFFDYIQRTYNEFPGERFYGDYQFLTPILVVKDPELLHRILVKDFDHFVDHATQLDHEAVTSKSLVFLKGQEWRSMRSILSPMFSSENLKTMHILFENGADKLVNYLLTSDTSMIEVKELFSKTTNDLIANCAFGVEVDSHADDNDFHRMSLEINSGLDLKLCLLAMSPRLVKLLNIKLVPQKMLDFFGKLIRESVDARCGQTVSRNDMIDLLMKAMANEKGVAVDDIVAHAVSFFFAASDSPSTLLSLVCYELALNPAVQERVRLEIQMRGSQMGCEKLKYLDAVVQETLRKYPAVAMLDRKCVVPYQLTPDILIPKDTLVWCPLFAIQRDPRYFPNPEVFDPERFCKELQTSTYLPFGAGPRQCLGFRFALLQAKTVLVRLLSEFTVKSNGRTQVPLKFRKRLLLRRAENGVWLTLEKRKKC